MGTLLACCCILDYMTHSKVHTLHDHNTCGQDPVCVHVCMDIRGRPILNSGYKSIISEVVVL